ncbi:MAG: alpha/beta fold hydrolase [Chitinophagaceae bacterium]|nr:MAG: alpha/beta fold hydrolase [Chitinophagaceae bacterium]
MIKTKNILVDGELGKPIALDIFYSSVIKQQPIVIYAHGFNGFKDWGNFDLIAEQFAAAGFFFIKFNFSHNGTTTNAPEDFVDLEAYGNNNYTKELADLQRVIDWALSKKNPANSFINPNNIFLVGHSRGGGIVLLKAAEEKRIKAVATWASVAECKTPWGNWTPERIERWKETGVDYYTNSRTKQQLPLYYQLYEDYQANKGRLDILKATAKLSIPILICHGTNDEAVAVEKAYQLKDSSQQVELFLVESDHVFGRKHPWTDTHLPQPMQDVVDRTISFFKALNNF